MKVKNKHRIRRAIEGIGGYGMIDGNHHKQWVLDPVVRSLLGKHNDARWRSEYEQDGEYEWDEGIAP